MHVFVYVCVCGVCINQGAVGKPLFLNKIINNLCKVSIKWDPLASVLVCRGMVQHFQQFAVNTRQASYMSMQQMQYHRALHSEGLMFGA